MCLFAAAIGCNWLVPPHDAPASTSASPAPTTAAPHPPTDAPPVDPPPVDARPADTPPIDAPPVAARPDPPASPAITPGPAIDPKILAAAEQARGTAEGKQAAAEQLRAGAKGDALWAAVYVYSTDGDDPKLLEPLLTGGDATIRVLAAGGLLRMGDRSGFAALIAETANPAILAGSEPPQSIGEIAALMLSMASGEALDITPGPATRKAWSDWYAAHADRLTYDPQTGWSAS